MVSETRYYLIDPILREKGYDDHQRLKLETPAPVEPTGAKGRRRRGKGRTDYLLCVNVGEMPKLLPVLPMILSQQCKPQATLFGKKIHLKAQSV